MRNLVPGMPNKFQCATGYLMTGTLLIRLYQWSLSDSALWCVQAVWVPCLQGTAPDCTEFQLALAYFMEEVLVLSMKYMSSVFVSFFPQFKPP